MDLHKRIASILQRYQDGKSKPEEEEMLDSILFEEVTPETAAEIEVSGFHKQQLWKRLEALHGITPNRRMPWYYAAAAAAALIIVFITFFAIKFLNQSPDISGSTLSELVVDDIGPGGNRAILKLADGRTINLDNNQEGIVVTTDGIAYADKGGLVLEQNLDNKTVVMQEVSTPRSGQYQITLHDGTKVWLNAETKLTYPSRFSADKRIVYLEGEAYFEVNEAPLAATDKGNAHKKPFIVITQHQEAKVLGTKFNINSFEKAIKTTLASGRLNVQNEDGTTVFLFPHEQSISTKDGLHKKKVSLLDELAWRNNKFSFDNKPFKTIMDEMGRWYNLHIVYQGAIPTIELTGDAFRNQNLSLILRVLDASNVVYKLEKESRKLTIY